MQIFNSKDGKYSIVADTYETRSSWGHIAKLYNNTTNSTVNTYKIRYYNRTWECYQYQSVALSVINDYINYLINNYIIDYKYDNNITKLPKQEREELTQQAKQTQIVQDLQNFYNELKERN